METMIRPTLILISTKMGKRKLKKIQGDNQIQGMEVVVVRAEIHEAETVRIGIVTGKAVGIVMTARVMEGGVEIEIGTTIPAPWNGIRTDETKDSTTTMEFKTATVTNRTVAIIATVITL